MTRWWQIHHRLVQVLPAEVLLTPGTFDEEIALTPVLVARGRAGTDVGSPAGPCVLVPPTRHSLAAVGSAAPARACGGTTSYGSLLLVLELALVVLGSTGISATLGRPGTGRVLVRRRVAVRCGSVRLGSGVCVW